MINGLDVAGMGIVLALAFFAAYAARRARAARLAPPPIRTQWRVVTSRELALDAWPLDRRLAPERAIRTAEQRRRGAQSFADRLGVCDEAA